MNKKMIILVPIIISFIGIILFYNITGLEERKIDLYDYRLTYSDKYEITSRKYLKLIDEIREGMIPIDEDGIVSEFRIGGFILFEERNKEIIESYRVQGSIVTKITYKNTNYNVLSTSYFKLDDKYYEELKSVCDKLRRRNRQRRVHILSLLRQKNISR
ncbi:MAG: hypothetical protein K0S47_1108 [Herbinix sp.]|jgi:hypothetical protein|nr:hypothetical protein [Herbinix sp.]